MEAQEKQIDYTSKKVQAEKTYFCFALCIPKKLVWPWSLVNLSMLLVCCSQGVRQLCKVETSRSINNPLAHFLDFGVFSVCSVTESNYKAHWPDCTR